MYKYIYKIHLFIHLFVDGHLDFFHILAIMNNISVNIGVHVSLFELVFWDSFKRITRSEVAGSYGSLFLAF